MTPTQARLIQERKARLQRLSANSVPDVPLEIVSASVRSARVPSRPRKTLADLSLFEQQEWQRRQLERFTMPEPKVWFSIADRPGEISIRSIQLIVCEFYWVKLRDLLSQRRTADIVHPRQVAMYLCHEHTSKSYPEIGRRFGGRDHTTALHAVRKIADLRNRDPDLAEELAQLTLLVEQREDETAANSPDRSPTSRDEALGPDSHSASDGGEGMPSLHSQE